MGQTGPKGSKPCQMGSYRANWGQTEQNGGKRGKLGPHLFENGDCPRDGDHSRDSYFPLNGHHPMNGYHTSNGDHHKGW